MTKHLHIVSFDVPYPADYGGVIEVFNKIYALYSKGIQIHLHCFEYGRGKQEILEQFCHSVFYYKRNTGHKGFSTSLPYIVSSRANPDLEKKLAEDDYPILLEGIQTTYLLKSPLLAERKFIIRLHNVEHDYYKNHANLTNNPFKKIIFFQESRLLKKYEKSIANRCLILALTDKDTRYYREKIGDLNVMTLSPFTSWLEPKYHEGIGTFCLYHGNLSIPENAAIAKWLLQKVFNKMEIPLVIAGKNPSPQLVKLAHKKSHTCIVANPSEKEMQNLIEMAQINIIPSTTETGIKFKLLNVLFNGRHCITNDKMISGTTLGPACHVANSVKALQSITMQLFRKPFDNEETDLRKELLKNDFNFQRNADKLISLIW
ncbi:MAG: glycosyltransferase [Chitinophagaceae bacterium]